MNRRDFLNAAAASAAAALAAPQALAKKPAADTLPNVIFILTDDQGWGDMGVYGHPYMKTPNLDRLANKSTRFTQFYVNATVCSPSRVAFMTGHFPARNNVHHIYSKRDFNIKHGVPDYLDPDTFTLADLMKQAGYITGHIGKWHLAGHVKNVPKPEELGFDVAMLTLYNNQHPLYKKRRADSENFVTDSSHWIMDDGIQFIKQQTSSGKPFFLNLWTHVPHAPLKPTSEELEVYAELQANPDDFDGWMKKYAQQAKKFTSQMKVFCAAMTSLDEAVGRLLDYLDAEGLADNTLIVFTSDNGPEDYHVGNSANAGVGNPGVTRGRKRSVYEGGIKVPCMVRWLGKVPAGKVSDAVWSGVDLMPTLAKITDTPLSNPDAMDGEDVSDIWFGSDREHKRPIFWEWKFEVAGNQKYLPPQLAIRDGKWKLLCNPDGSRTELYDIPADPQERNNLAEKHPKITKKLQEKLLNWKKTIPEKYERS